MEEIPNISVNLPKAFPSTSCVDDDPYHTISLRNPHFELKNQSICDKLFEWVLEAQINAPRTSGVEAVLITTKYQRLTDPQIKFAQGSIYNFALGLSFIHMVDRQHWKSKDHILLMTPSSEALESWLYSYQNLQTSDQDYYSKLNEKYGQNDYNHPTIFYKHYFIFSSISLDLATLPYFSGLSLRIEGQLGQIPNLDLFYTVTKTAQNVGIMTICSEIIPFIKPINYIFSQFGFYFDHDKIYSLNTLYSFILRMANGIPNGDHSYMSKYQINALTISSYGTEKSVTPLMVAKALEGTIRSLNNLIEPFHHSVWFYLPLSSYSFVPIQNYIISFFLLISGIFLYALLTLIKIKPQKLYQPLLIVLISTISGSLIFLSPRYLNDLYRPHIKLAFKSFLKESFIGPFLEYSHLLTLVEETSFIFLIFASFVCFITIIFLIKFWPQSSNQKVVNSIATIPAIIFLSSISLINISFSLVVAILFIPMLWIAQIDGSKFLKIFKIVFILITSPWVLIIIISINYELSFLEVIDYLNTIISNWFHYSSLLFPFISIIYIPFSLITIASIFSFNKRQEY